MDLMAILDKIGSGAVEAFGKPSQGDHTDEAAIVSEDDKACRTTGITDKGVIKAAKWKAIVAGAVLGYNTLNSLRMAKLQRDLGKRYLKLAEDHRNYYNARFKPLEIELTKEALKLPKYKRDKENLYTGQMLVSAKARSAGKINKAMSCTGRYCTGQRAAIMTDQLLEQAIQESMIAGLAHRYTDKEEINHNNLRWEKREQVMKIGRDLPAEAVSYASLAAGTFGSLGKQAGAAAEGAMGFLAYGRGETNYPPRRGPFDLGEYKYIPPKIDTYKPKPPENYTKPEPPQPVKVAG